MIYKMYNPHDIQLTNIEFENGKIFFHVKINKIMNIKEFETQMDSIGLSSISIEIGPESIYIYVFDSICAEFLILRIREMMREMNYQGYDIETYYTTLGDMLDKLRKSFPDLLRDD